MAILTRTFTDALTRLNPDNRPKRFPYCACGHSFDHHERMYDGRCEECHDKDTVIGFEEWDTLPSKDDLRQYRVL